MHYRLRAYLVFVPLVAVIVAGYVILQLKAIEVARESAEDERAKEAALNAAP